MKLRNFIRSAMFILTIVAGFALPPASEAARFNAQAGLVHVAAETQTECHVTIQGENGETITACKREEGNGEKVEGEVPMERIERAFRVDTSKGACGGPNSVIHKIFGC